MDPVRRSHSLAARHNAEKEDVHEPLSCKLRSAYAGRLGHGAHRTSRLGVPLAEPSARESSHEGDVRCACPERRLP